MTAPVDGFLAGIGVGLLIAALALKLADLSWLVVSAGAIALIVAGTEITAQNRS